MNNEKFCPILMIGFDPPEKENIPDMRICNPGCAWYDEVEQCCILISLNVNIQDMIDYTCASSMGNISEYEGF